MASLTGNKIKDSYLGLLKSIDNIDFVPRGAGVFVQISDGDGNGLPLYLSTAGIRFHNAYTFPSATGTVGQVLSADAAGDLVFSDQLDNQTLEQVLTRGNTTTLAILSTASGNTFGSTTFSGIATLANASKVLGTPPTANDSSTNIATTAYVDNQVNTGGTVKKTGTIAQNAIAVWNNTSDTLRSDDTISVLTDGTITLTQEDTTGAAQKNYNIGGGNIALNTGNFNTGFGKDNLNKVAFTTGGYNNAFGYNTLFSMTTGGDNNAFGAHALYSETTGNGNISIGGYSMYNSENVYFSTVIGTKALYSNTTGTQNMALGYESLYTNVSGDANTSLGYRALKANLGDRNIAVGYGSGILMTTGDNNVILGSFSGVRAAAAGVSAYDISASNNNIVISDGSGNVFQSFDSTGKTRLHNYGGGTFTGTLTKTLGVDVNGNVIEVDAATGDVSISGTPVANQITIWTDATTIKGDATFTIDANHKITLYQPNSADPIVDTSSYNIGGGNIANVTGLRNTGFGYSNLVEVLTGTKNSAFGFESLKSLTNGSNNSAFGQGSLISLTTGDSNTAFGVRSLAQNTVKSGNSAFGHSALTNLNGTFLPTYSINNVAIGANALYTCLTSSFNVAVGHTSLYFLTTGDANTALGYNSGSAMTTGSKNVIIGGFTGFRAAVSGGLPEYDIKTSSNNIVLSDGDGNVRQSFDSNGAATFSGNATFTKNQNTDTSIKLFNPNIGTSTEATIYVTSSSSNSDGLFLGTMGINTPTIGGFVQYGSHIGSGTGESGGLSIMTRASADIRFYTNGHTNERMRITSGGNVGIGTLTPSGYFFNGGGMGIYGGTTRTTLSLISNTFSSLYFSKGDGTSSDSGAQAYRGYIDYQHSNDSLQFGTSQQERMRISDTGGVTFNSSEDNTVTINTTNTDNNYLTFKKTNTDFGYLGTGTGILQGIKGFVTGDFILRSELAIKLCNGNNAAFTITSGGDSIFSGDVNIYKAAAIMSIGASSAGGYFGFMGWDDTASSLYLGNSYDGLFNKDLIITSTGNILVGLADVGINVAKFEIETASAITYTPSANITGTNLRLVTAGTGGTNVTTGIALAVGGSSEAYIGAVQNSLGEADIVFQSFGDEVYSEKLRITSRGNVGINVAPSSTRTLLLKGIGTTSSTAPFQVNDGNNADILVIKDDKTATFSGKVKVSDGGNATTPSFRIGSDTNGISTPATNQLNFITNSLTRILIRDSGWINIYDSMSLENGLHVGTTSYGMSDSFSLSSGVITSSSGWYDMRWNPNTGVVFHDGSCRLIKENIIDSPYGLDTILQLKARKYYRIDGEKDEIGFIADEVENIIPELVAMSPKSLFTKNDNDTEIIAGNVDYGKITAVLTKAIQEQQTIIEDLKTRIKKLEE